MNFKKPTLAFLCAVALMGTGCVVTSENSSLRQLAIQIGLVSLDQRATLEELVSVSEDLDIACANNSFVEGYIHCALTVIERIDGSEQNLQITGQRGTVYEFDILDADLSQQLYSKMAQLQGREGITAFDGGGYEFRAADLEVTCDSATDCYGRVDD